MPKESKRIMKMLLPLFLQLVKYKNVLSGLRPRRKGEKEMIAIMGKAEYEEMSRAKDELQTLIKRIESCVMNPADVIYHDAPVDFSIQRVSELLRDVITDC